MFGTGYLVAPDCMDLEDFCNDYTLNIFTDASMNAQPATAGCYGAVAIYKDKIIDESYWYDNRMMYNKYVTSNCCEAKGLRLGLNLALKYAVQGFTFINIFSDSLLTVNTIRSYMARWFYEDNRLYTGNNKPASNQELHVENRILLDTLLSINPNIRIYHQNGHINENSPADIDKAFSNFKLYNNIPSWMWVDRRIIKYISRYNNYIDKSTRSKLREEMDISLDYHDPIRFHAMNDYTKPNLVPCHKMKFDINDSIYGDKEE